MDTKNGIGHQKIREYVLNTQLKLNNRRSWQYLFGPSIGIMALFILMLAVTLTSCNTRNMDPSQFPANFHHPNPIHDGQPNSLYIFDISSVESNTLPPNYYSFYNNIDSNLQSLIKNSSNKAFAKWLESLTHTTKLLEVHDNDFFNQRERQFSNHYLQFTDHHAYDDWQQQYPSYGYNIELVEEDVSDLPASLQEVYALGMIWLFGVPNSGFFYHPRDIKNALDEPYLGEYISDEAFENLNYPLADLKVFYTDSACWLMYDSEENVYCGGVECGDFYKSSKKLDDVISTIFTQLLIEGDRLSIESFAPKAID